MQRRLALTMATSTKQDMWQKDIPKFQTPTLTKLSYLQLE